MKEYHIYPNVSGDAIKISQEGDEFKISVKEVNQPEWKINDDTIIIQHNVLSPRFSKENLITQLEDFIKYLKKYG